MNSMEQIARDIREGTFPKKSEATQTEDRARVAYDAFRNGFGGGVLPPEWDKAPAWVRDAVHVAYLQGKLDKPSESALKSDLATLNCHSEQIDGPVDLAHNPIPASLAWSVILKWIDDYSEEEASFSRYRDDVILDGIMTAAQRRALAALFPKAARITKPADDRCENCGQDLPLLHPCTNEECPIPGHY